MFGRQSLKLRRSGHGFAGGIRRLDFSQIPGDIRLLNLFEESVEIGAAFTEPGHGPEPRAHHHVRALKGQERVAGVADAGDAQSGAHSGVGPHAQVEVATGEHFQRAGTVDLDVARQGVLPEIERVPRGPGGHPRERVGLVKDHVASGGDHTHVVCVGVLDIKRRVAQVVPGDDPGELGRVEGEPGDVARARVEPDRVGVAGVQHAGGMERLFVLQHLGGAEGGAGLREERIDHGQEEISRALVRGGGGADQPAVSQRQVDPGDRRRVGVGNVDRAGAPRAHVGVGDELVGEPVGLQPVDCAASGQLQGAAGGGSQRQIPDEPEIARERRGPQRARQQSRHGFKRRHLAFVEPQPGLIKRGRGRAAAHQQELALQPSLQQRPRAGVAGQGDILAEGHVAAERAHINRAGGRVGGEIGLVPERVAHPAREQERVGRRPKEHVPASRDVEAPLAHEKRGGQPRLRGLHLGRHREDRERGGPRGVGQDLAAGLQCAPAFFNVINAAIDVVSGLDRQIAAAEFHQPIGPGGALGHPGVGRRHGVDIGDVASGAQRHVAAAQGADALEEIAEIHPPRRGGDVAPLPGRELAGVLVDVTAAVEPVHGQLPRGIGDQRAGGVAGLMDEIVAGLDADVAASVTVLGGRQVLDRAQSALTAQQTEDRQIEIIGRKEAGRLRHPRSGGVNRGELVEQLHVPARRDVDVAGTGPDHLEPARQSETRLGAGAQGGAGGDVRAAVFAEQQGARRGREPIQCENPAGIHRAQVRPGGKPVRPRLGVGGKQRVLVEQRGRERAGVEPVAEPAVDEHEVPRRPQGEHPGGALGSEPERGKIPVRAELEIACAMDDLRAGLDHENRRERRIGRQQAIGHGGVTRAGDPGRSQECVGVGSDGRLHRGVDRARGPAQGEEPVTFHRHPGRRKNLAADGPHVHIRARRRLRRAQMQRAGELPSRRVSSGRHGKIERGARLQIQERAGIKTAVALRARLQPNAAALACRVKGLSGHAESRP